MRARKGIVTEERKERTLLPVASKEEQAEGEEAEGGDRDRDRNPDADSEDDWRGEVEREEEEEEGEGAEGVMAVIPCNPNSVMPTYC